MTPRTIQSTEFSRPEIGVGSLSLCTWHFKGVPMHLESTSQRHYTKVLNISRLISLFIPNSAILEPWNRSYADAQEAMMLEIVSLNFLSSKKVTISPARIVSLNIGFCFCFLSCCITVTDSKLILLSTQQANKWKDKVLGQKITTLFQKPGNWEDGRLVS